MRLVVAVTGASGSIYAVNLLKALKARNVEVHLILSNWAVETLRIETGMEKEELIAMASHYHQETDMAVLVSSGSFQHQGMVVIPCSMKTLAGIAHGYASNLIIRAADVTLKERRKLVLVPRETPLSIIHLENLLTLARSGAVILPPMPAFYNHPRTIDHIVNHLVARVLDQFGIEQDLSPRWGEEDKKLNE